MYNSQQTFSKNELIQLHRLGAKVKEDLEKNSDINFDESDYEDLGIQPVDAHRKKSDHQEAVKKLFDEISTNLERELEENLENSKERFDIDNEEPYKL